MAELMSGMKRTAYCAEFTAKDVGRQVTVTGWADSWRNHGGLIFIDLRDRSGIMQVVFDLSAIGEKGFEKAEAIRTEYVIAVTGTVRTRDEDRVNPRLKTGNIEILASELRILSEAERKLLADGAGKALFLAGRWAAKEAFAKALGTGFAQGMGPCDIEVLRLPSGAPCIEPKGRARELWLSAGAGKIHVSISHDTDYALAFVVIE